MRAVGRSLTIAALIGTLSAASLLTVHKTPAEAFNLGVDFTQVIGQDGLAVVGVVATDQMTGADVTAAMVASSPAPAPLAGTDKVMFRVQGGQNSQNVLIGVRAMDLTTGEIYEGQITVLVVSGTGH
jgi:hypothetical protein